MENITEDWGLKALEIDESAPKKKDVLMVLGGETFFSKIASRNKRSYPGETWPKALAKPETKHLLENGLMFGTVGHLEADMDALIRDNKVAIRTTQLSFDRQSGIGKGRYEVLNTDLGRLIKVLHDSGSKFFVSTKAIGEYKGTDSEGNQKVDPDNFILKRIDLVCDPGFLQAQPKLQEQLEEAYKQEPEKNIILECQKDLDKILQDVDKEDVNMSNELVEKVMTEKIALETVIEGLTKDLKLSETEVKALQIIEKQSKTQTSRLEELETELTRFSMFCDEVGTLDEIKETLFKTKAFGEKVKELGGVESIEQNLEELEAFLQLGDNADSMKEALQVSLEQYKALSELVDVEDDENPIDKIKEALEASKIFIEDKNNQNLKEQVAEVSAKFGIEESKVLPLVEAKGKDGAIAILEDLSVTSKKIAITKEDNDESDINTKSENRVDRMYASHIKS